MQSEDLSLPREEQHVRPAYDQPRAVRVLLGAAAVTYVGDEVTAVALALSLYAAGASGLTVAALFVAKVLPVVLLAPLSGWATDRFRPDHLLVVSSLVAAAVVAGISVTTSPALWLAGTALLAATTSVSQPCLLVLLPHAAGPASRRRVLSAAAVASRSSAATGALLAGVLVALGGLQLALLVDAASYLLVVVAVRWARTRVPEPEQAAAPSSGPGRPALAGLRLVSTDPVLRVVLGVLLTAISFVGISYVAAVFFAQDVLGTGPRGATLVTAAYGAGMTVGCLLAARVPVRHLLVVAVRAPLVVGLAFLAPVLVRTLPVAVLGFAVAGLCMGTAITAMRALVLERVPAGLLGRVWAAEMALGVCGELLALLTAGVVLATAGPVAAVALCGSGALAAGLVGLAALRPGAEPPAPALAVAPAVVPVPAPRAPSALPSTSSSSAAGRP